LQLARTITGKSTWSQVPDNPFGAEPDSEVDPNSSNFKPRAWVKSILKLRSHDPKSHPDRTSGIAFKGLNVHGYGSGTDYQKNVGNMWLEVIGIAQKLLGVGQRRIDILRDFDGLVKSGEMLVVLGPPGSGCSTFLKTIAGETHGFVVEASSHLNYQGTKGAQWL
jgi:ATP-binding cassette, subfamily G (WHITE), member 2, PDR